VISEIKNVCSFNHLQNMQTGVFVRGHLHVQRHAHISPTPLLAWVRPAERQRSLERARIARPVPICGIIVVEIKDLTVTLTQSQAHSHTCNE